MAGARDYSAGTRAALACLSHGKCYFPGCTRQIIVVEDDGQAFTQYHIAHIHDARPGNRFDPNVTDDERRSFSNLILLCGPHHERIDQREPEKYSIEMLHQWKVDHERQLGLQAGLESFTEDTLGPALIAVAENVSITIIGSAEGGSGGSSPYAGGGGGGGIGPGARGGDGGPGGSLTVAPPGLLPPGVLYYAYADGAQGGQGGGPGGGGGGAGAGAGPFGAPGGDGGAGTPEGGGGGGGGGGFDLKACLESLGLTLDDPRITWHGPKPNADGSIPT
jgi:hypothetical protein